MLISLVAGAGLAYVGGRLGLALWPARSTERAHRPAGPRDPAAPRPLVDPPPTPAGPLTVRDRDLRRRLLVSGGGAGLLAASAAAPLLWWPGAALTGWFFGGTLRASWRLLRDEGKLGVPLLDVVALTGIIGSGYLTLAASGSFVTAGADWLARRTERRTRADLADAFGLRGETVRRWVDGRVEEVSWRALLVGDVVVVDAGEAVPVDGVVVDGCASLDVQQLTGEATPVDCGVGDRVHAATLVLAGRVRVEVIRSGDETLAAELVALLDEVEQTRADGVSRAHALAESWVPAALGLTGGALLIFGPYTASAVAATGIGYGVRYAGPTTVLRHVRHALNAGVLVRDGRALERLAAVDVVVFDKTGTLTCPTPVVRRVTATGSVPAREVLRLAAAAERHQTHPIGVALRAAASGFGSSPDGPQRATVLPGLGLSVQVDGRSVLVGSRRLMAAQGIALLAEPPARAERTLVYVAVDGALAGVIELSARLRPEAPAVSAGLRRRGAEVLVLSGDREAPTARLAEVLGLDGCFAEVLPRGKAEFIRELQATGRTVCFVGDGINDTIALGVADVSISLRGAASVAEDVADIVLLDGDLAPLPVLFDIAGSVDRNVDRSARINLAAGLGSVAGIFTLGFGMGTVLTLFMVGVGAAMSNALLAPIPERAPGLDDAGEGGPPAQPIDFDEHAAEPAAPGSHLADELHAGPGLDRRRAEHAAHHRPDDADSADLAAGEVQPGDG